MKRLIVVLILICVACKSETYTLMKCDTSGVCSLLPSFRGISEEECWYSAIAYVGAIHGDEGVYRCQEDK